MHVASISARTERVTRQATVRRSAPFQTAWTLAFVLCFACLGTAFGQLDDEAIVALGEAWETRYNEGDVQGIGSMYTNDALYATSSGMVVEGPEQIANLLQGFIDAGFETVTLERRKLRVVGDMAYDFGRWVLTHTEGMTIEGYYVSVLVRTADGWMYDHNGNSLIEPEEG